jgi:hypothetical protein
MPGHRIHRVALCPLLPNPEKHSIVYPHAPGSPEPLPQLPSNACRGVECAWFCLQGDPKTGLPMVDRTTGQQIGSCAMVVAAGQLAQLAGLIGAIASVRAAPAPTEEKPS